MHVSNWIKEDTFRGGGKAETYKENEMPEPIILGSYSRTKLTLAENEKKILYRCVLVKGEIESCCHGQSI